MPTFLTAAGAKISFSWKPQPKATGWWSKSQTSEPTSMVPEELYGHMTRCSADMPQELRRANCLYRSDTWRWPSLFDRYNRDAYSYENGELEEAGAKTLDEFRAWYGRAIPGRYEQMVAQVFPAVGEQLNPRVETALLLSALVLLDDSCHQEEGIARREPLNLDYERPNISLELVHNTLVLALMIYAEPLADNQKQLGEVAKALQGVVLEMRGSITKAEPIGIAPFKQMLATIYQGRLLGDGESGKDVTRISVGSLVTTRPAEIATAEDRDHPDILDPRVLELLGLPTRLGWRPQDVEELAGLGSLERVKRYVVEEGLRVMEQGERSDPLPKIERMIEQISQALPRLVPGQRMTQNLRAALIVGIFRAVRTMHSAPGLPFYDVLFDTMGDSWSAVADFERKLASGEIPPLKELKPCGPKKLKPAH